MGSGSSSDTDIDYDDSESVVKHYANLRDDEQARHDLMDEAMKRVSDLSKKKSKEKNIKNMFNYLTKKI